jgi:hypothetical protein
MTLRDTLKILSYDQNIKIFYEVTGIFNDGVIKNSVCISAENALNSFSELFLNSEVSEMRS